MAGPLHSSVSGSPLPPAPLLRHCAEMLDGVVGYLARQQPVSPAGRGLIAHIACRLRSVAEVIEGEREVGQ